MPYLNPGTAVLPTEHVVVSGSQSFYAVGICSQTAGIRVKAYQVEDPSSFKFDPDARTNSARNTSDTVYYVER